jgi:hypothetical protein
VRIDKRLNLVIPVERADGFKVFVHATPVSSDLFEVYWEPVSKAFANIYSGGYSVVAGPRIAAKMLRKVSTEMGVWEGQNGVQQGLVAEIHRLTNVFAPGKRGWEMVPFDEAKKTHLDSDEASEIEGALCFFTVASLTHRKADLPAVLAGAADLWGAQTTLLGCTEFMNSLPTSIETENSGETATT